VLIVAPGSRLMPEETEGLNVVGMPIKCPVAPLELCFLADPADLLGRARGELPEHGKNRPTT